MREAEFEFPHSVYVFAGHTQQFYVFAAYTNQFNVLANFTQCLKLSWPTTTSQGSEVKLGPTKVSEVKLGQASVLSLANLCQESLLLLLVVKHIESYKCRGWACLS